MSSTPCFSKSNLKYNQLHSPRLLELLKKWVLLKSWVLSFLLKNNKISVRTTRGAASLLNVGILRMDFRICGQFNLNVIYDRFNLVIWRGIQWPLWAFVSMRTVRLFLRAWAVIKFVLWAVSTSENVDGEQWALCKFSAGWNLSFKLKGKVVLRQVIWLKLPKG